MDTKQQRQLILETIETLLAVQIRSVRQILGKEDIRQETGRPKGRRRKSLIDLSVKILTEEQRPVHIDQLVDLLRERHGRITDRDSLSSALAKKAKQGILVHRISPATFTVRRDDGAGDGRSGKIS